MKELYDKVSMRCSRMTTRAYSTSFSLGISFLQKEFHDPIYAIYGFVRFADEIVDTFHDYDKSSLLERFRADTYKAIEEGISLNPILNSYQHVVNQYGIPMELTDTFLDSMEMDLHKSEYTTDEELKKYVLGSAEVVGLMCLKVFTRGDDQYYEDLRYYAMQLGSAFQKINFLRDLHTDYVKLGRTYFPGLDVEELNDESKAMLEEEIEKEFAMGYEGIKRLPKGARFGVYVAYVYYYALFRKIKSTTPATILETRIRIPNRKKYSLLVGCYVKHSLNMI